MRLENYYSLITKQRGCTKVDEYNTLEEILNNIDLDDRETLNENDSIEITHTVEYYDGTLEETTLYLYKDGNVETMTQDFWNVYVRKVDNYDSGFITINGNQYVTKETYQNKIDELEAQFGFECECNKDLVKTQNENERLRVLLFNAIVYLENDFDNKEQLLDELGMTKAEYKDIMGEE